MKKPEQLGKETVVGRVIALVTANIPLLMIVLVVGTVSYMTYLWFHERSLRANDQLKYTNALVAQERVYKNKWNQEVHERDQIRAAELKDFLKVEDKRFARLQQELKRYKPQMKGEGSSVSVFNDSTGITETMLLVKQGEKLTARSAPNKWYTILSEQTRDSVKTHVSMYHEFTTAIVEEDGKTVFKVSDNNPNSNISESYSYQDAKKHNELQSTIVKGGLIYLGIEAIKALLLH